MPTMHIAYSQGKGFIHMNAFGIPVLERHTVNVGIFANNLLGHNFKIRWRLSFMTQFTKKEKKEALPIVNRIYNYGAHGPSTCARAQHVLRKHLL